MLGKKRPKILIVEDDELLLTTLGEICEAKGCDPKMARNGYQALDVLATDKVELVISDVRMPGLDGLSLLKTIHSRGYEIPVILMSGYSDCTTEDVDNANGVTLLEKPFSAIQIEEIFQTYMELLVG